MKKITYYANPPHIPSTPIKAKTIKNVNSSLPVSKTPNADSVASVKKIIAWIIAGSGNNFDGRGGSPTEILDRDMKTAV